MIAIYCVDYTIGVHTTQRACTTPWVWTTFRDPRPEICNPPIYAFDVDHRAQGDDYHEGATLGNIY